MSKLRQSYCQMTGNEVDMNKMIDNPVDIEKVEGGYRVSTPGGVKARHTTLKKAKSQKRLLNAIKHGWKPTGEK